MYFFSTGNAIHFVFNKCNKLLPTYFDIVSAVRNVTIKDDLYVLYKVTLDFFYDHSFTCGLPVSFNSIRFKTRRRLLFIIRF